MAMSKCIIQAQDTVNCHLCESEPNIKWRCLVCELFMCDNCRHRVHPKFKDAKVHKIIDIKDVGLNTGQGERNLDFTNIKCKQHTKHTSCLFCSTRDCLVCPSCVAIQHHGHQFLEIKDVYEMKVERLKNGQRRMEREKEQLKSGDEKLESIKSSETTKHKNIKQNIQNRKEALIKAANLYSDKLLSEADEEIKTIQGSVSKEKLKVSKIMKTLEDNEKQAENLIHTTDTTKFFEDVDNIGRLLDEKIDIVNLIQRGMSEFVPGHFFQANVGSLIEDATSNKAFDQVEMRVKQCFTTQMNHIKFTTVSPNGSLWIGDAVSKELQHIRLDSSRLTMISTFSIPFIRGIVVTSDNKLLFTNALPVVRQISGKGQIIDSKYNVHHPLGIITVHINTDQILILGAISSDKPFPVTGRRVVILMNQLGKQEKIYENDRHNQRILSYPLSITSTTKGNIFVVDMISDDHKGRIVVLSEDGSILNIYNGHPEITTKELPFNPVRVATTPADNVLVTNANTNYIYILNNTGYLTTQINCEDHGIIYPYSMAFSGIGQLYIGNSPPLGSIKKANLYEVELSGC